MAFITQTYTEQGVGDSRLSSTADSVFYVKQQDALKMCAAWNTHKSFMMPALDTEGIPVLVLINNGDNKNISYKKLSTERMVTEALADAKTKTLYTVGYFPGQPPHYYQSSNGIHIQSIVPYIDNRDLLPKIINTGDSPFSDFVPVGLFGSSQESDNMNLIEAVSVNSFNFSDKKDTEQALKRSPEQVVGQEFVRNYDAPGLWPDLYWLTDKY